MKIIETELSGVLILEPKLFEDERGYFLEHFQAERYAGLGMSGVVQLNHSRSLRGTVRGLHFQQPHPQGKLVWVATGTVFDVAVDVRKGSPQFGRWVGVELSAENHKQAWIPEGFAHGFCVRSDYADVYYACTQAYAPECQKAVAWNDPRIGIDWNLSAPILSDRDREAPLLADAPLLPLYDG